MTVPSAQELLDQIVAIRKKLDEAKRTVVCAEGRGPWLMSALEAAGLAPTVNVVESEFVEGTDVYVVNHLALGF